MKKRTIIATSALIAAMALPLGKDYANSNPEKSTLDDALPKGEIIVEKILSPFEMLQLQYDSATLDSILSRPRTKYEEKVDSILENMEYNYNDMIEKNFVKAIIKKESSYISNVVSYVGARGYMQIMPDTWDMMGKGKFENAFNPEKNINAGIKYLKFLDNFVKENHPRYDTLSKEETLRLISAAYNGGHGRLQKENWDITQMPKQSRDYQEKVLQYKKEFDFEKEIITAYYYIPREEMYASIDSIKKESF